MTHDILHSIDEPVTWNTATPVLVVRGWCFDRSGDTIVAIEIETANGLVRAPVGLARPDVAAAFDHVKGSAASGFCFHLSNRPGEIGSAKLHAVHLDGRRTPLRTISPVPFCPSAGPAR